MWFVIVGVLSVGLGVIALLGLLAVAKELFCDSSVDTNSTYAGGVAVRHDVGDRTSGRRYVMPR
jgi:hypothetical protein